jgi:hypothetical protein
MTTKSVRQTVKQQNVRNRMNKDKNLRRENNTLKIKRNLRTSDVLMNEVLQQKCCETFEETDRTVKNTYDTPIYFIGRKGVAPRNRLDATIASFQGDTCLLRRSEGDFFFSISGVFVESDHQSQSASRGGLVSGNWAQTFHPRNSRSY